MLNCKRSMAMAMAMAVSVEKKIELKLSLAFGYGSKSMWKERVLFLSSFFRIWKVFEEEKARLSG